jgi:DNA-binding MarR family transcriptional regulator
VSLAIAAENTNHTWAAERQPDLDRALREVWPRWQSLLWQNGMRTMHRKMLEMNHTMSEQMILRRLLQQTMSVAEVAEELAITPSAASRAVDRLVRDGLVARQECPHDRRQRALSLTEHGETTMRALAEEFAASLIFLVEGLSPQEQTEFLHLLQRMIDQSEARNA